MQNETPDFVFYLSSDWESFHRPDMLFAFAKHIKAGGGRLLVMDRFMCPITGPLRGLRTPLAGPSRGFRKWGRLLARKLTGKDQIETLEENFFLGRAFTLIDDRIAHRSFGLQGLRPLLSLNRTIVRRQVRRMMRRLGLAGRPLVTWFHYPLWVHYVGMLHEQLSVYECYDEHTAIPGLSLGEARRIRESERELFGKVDLVFTTSQELLEAKRRYHQRIYCVPNAADIAFYAEVSDRSQPVDPHLSALPRPIVGYLGTIHTHTDIPLVRYVAEHRPEWTLVLIGKVDQREVAASDDFKALQRLPNTQIMGWVDRDRLLSICRGFDVCIIPYRQGSEFNRYVNPNKLHEYTAMGKPIVAQEGIEVDSHKDLIWITRTPDEFVAAIEEAYATDSDAKIAQRLRFAREHSWDVRVRRMVERVAEALERS